ncbi:MAG: GspE/PulE family protein [Candidatus Omnitrophica bacterium]|nr:GspE/PulE family protein [Candidatus Omnitrophota bacterium]
MDHPAISKLLESHGISREQIDLVIKEKQRTGAPFGYLLVRFGLMNSQSWFDFVLKNFHIAPVRLEEMQIENAVLRTLPEFTCRKYQVIPIYKSRDKIVCGMVDPIDNDVIEQIKKISGLEVETRLVKEEDLRKGFDRYFSQVGMEVISPVTSTDEKFYEPVKLRELDKEATAESSVISMIEQAVELKATDIHLEIEEDGARLRYRINGILYEFPAPPLELYPAIVSHIKVLSNLDISEKRVPQDGYFKARISGRSVDLRVSTFPTIFGEMVALRVLDKANIITGLEQLGFLPEILHRWRMLLDEPYGMLLVTGPTGSGKTTTLYSSLNEIDNLHKKVITVEDPVEYHLKNINQIQINPKAGLTFSVALRSILRQDPNVVMIGEIRDLDSASIAFRAAQTGQLVLATLHTNTAPGAVIRLLDMGVESYLLASSLIGVLSQRLVRTICPNCKEVYKPLEEEVRELSPQLIGKDIRFYRGKGCHLCKGTGYGGRTGLHELMIMNEELRRMTMRDPSTSSLTDVARKFGMKSLREDGIQKVLYGTTTISEVLYATKKDTDER